MCGRRKNALQETAAAFPEGSDYRICAVDLLDGGRTAEMLKNIIMETGPAAGLVHCAGVRTSVPLKMISEEQLLTDYHINVVSGFILARLLSGKKFTCPTGASFVFLASAAGHRGAAGILSYTANKGALLSGVRALASELAVKKIRVNTVSPGFVLNTGITNAEFDAMPTEAKIKIENAHLLGLGHVSDVAKPIIFLLGDDARWITGADLKVDGGFCI